MIVPDTVFAISRGDNSYNTITMQKTGDNEYAGEFTDLKESVRFTVRGEDYYTPYRKITAWMYTHTRNTTTTEMDPLIRAS